MRSLVAVDLAAKYSAVCWMSATGAVIEEWDSWGRTEAGFVHLVTAPFRHCATPPDALIIEDLPHRLPFMALVKHVCRLQGRIIEAMDRLGLAGHILFVPPAEWRRNYTGLGRGTGPDAVIPVAARLGYTPPDLTDRLGERKAKATIAKVQTDYAAAFLIGRWALGTWLSFGSFDTATTSRYTTV